MADLPIRVFGGVRLEGADGTVRAGGVLAERLLGVLITADGASEIDVLADALWPSDALRDPVPPLRMAVSRLRRRLAEVGLADAVKAMPRSYRLVVAPSLIDVGRFSSHIDEARRVADTEPDRAAALLDGALALWRGTPFGPLASEHWAAASVAQLVERRLAAEEELADLDLRRDREGLVVDRLIAAADSAPLRERRWVQLATALYRLGRQAEALRAVHKAQEMLRDELGIEPGEDLRQIERSLLEQAPTLLSSGESTSGAAARERLVGRDLEVIELGHLLAVNRVVTVHGLGGVGKSVLAHAVATAHRDRAVITAQLHGVADPQEVWLAVATAAGVGGSEEVHDLPAAVAGRLSRRPTLLVLDGAHAGADTAAEVADSMLVMAPSVAILVTSRTPIGATDEVRYALEPLRVGTTYDPGPAIELFLARAGTSRARLDDAAGEAVVRTCERAGGLPLALELAAASLDLRGAGALLSSGPAGGSGELGAGVLHQMVRWSLEVLPATSRLLLAQTTLLPGGTTTTAVSALAGVDHAEVRAVVAPLLQARLLGAIGGAGKTLRYAAPEAVVEVAADMLHDSQREHARSAVLGHLLGVMDAVGGFDERPRLDAIPAAEAELDNVRYWLQRTVGTAAGLELAVATARTLAEIGLGAESARWLRQHRAALPALDQHLDARATVAASGSQEVALDVAELEHAATVLEEHQSWRAWLYLRGRLVLALSRIDPSTAKASLHAPVVLERLAIVDDPWMYAQHEWLAGVLPAWGGHLAEARSSLVSFPDRFLALGDPSAALFILYIRAFLARGLGDLAEVENDLTRARELAAGVVARSTQARIAAELAHLSRAKREASAVPMLVLAIDQLERAGSARSAATERRNLGAWRIADGDTNGGLADLRGALPMLLRIDAAGAAIALSEIAGAIAPLRPAKAARLAGAAKSRASSGYLSSAQQALVDDLAATFAALCQDAFAEGQHLDEESLLDLALTT